MNKTLSLFVLLAWSAQAVLADVPEGEARPDVSIAGKTQQWRTWTGVGAAFKNNSSGNSRQGFKVTGTLTSPEFTIERKQLNFRIGGGASKKLRLELLVGDKVVRQSSSRWAGMNVEPDGWDVADLQGQTVRLRMVDEETEGIDHIEVSHVCQTDRLPLKVLENLERTIRLDKPLLLLPVMFETSYARRQVTLCIGGKEMRIFRTSLAPDGVGDASMPLDVSPWLGQDAVLKVDRLEEGNKGLEGITVADRTPGDEAIYTEPNRPIFHFSPSRGWMGDPNGLVYYKGVWHFFWQHNPYGVDHSNMCWGHAISRDLFHWTELPVAIYNDYRPNGLGSIYSGGGFIDHGNSAGFRIGDEEVMVLAFLATAKGPSLSYSNDGGKTFTLYGGNPVIPDGGWDPKVIWLDSAKHWVMATSKSQKKGAAGVTFYTSQDLKHWAYASWMEGMNECPELFELPVDGNPSNMMWMVYGNGGPYSLGQFDGKTFKTTHGPYQKQSGEACQTWSNVPEGRRVELGLHGRSARGPWVGIQTLPVEITLRRLPDGSVRAFKNPVRELDALRSRVLLSKANEVLQPGIIDLGTIADDPMDIIAEFAVDPAALAAGAKITVMYRGVLTVYDAAKPKMCDVDVLPEKGVLKMRVVVDRVVHESFYNDGLVYLRGFHEYREAKPDRTLRIKVEKAAVKLIKLEVHELGKAGWKPFDSRQLISAPTR